MRDIKFRAWDKKNNTWIADGNTMDLYYSAEVNTFMFDNDNYDLGENVEFVQFTGLKDKNGVEIYEGDIVKEMIDKDHQYIIGDSHPHEVVFGSGAFYVDNDFGTSLMFVALEVIGNKFENPELIK